MNDYSIYSNYYDSVNKSYNFCIPFIRSNIDHLKNKNKSLIEFGCGTGNILKEFSTEYVITGIDLLENMLNIARNKLKNCNLKHSDMTEYYENKKYDVFLCMFDTLNHVLDINKWDKMFNNIAKMMHSR